MRDLRAKVLVSAAMAAFTHGVDEWAAGGGKGNPGVLVDKAFTMVDEA